ncbi:unnamed protein product [Enterobius vermicularis]|uniref:Hexosyltransferase n=1 Tax=Enterobius vermicularis TaxID=51028 RepID=A0A0N4UTY7_ENTVE|nr:unnamed protein product [Enterobius vermicularis]
MTVRFVKEYCDNVRYIIVTDDDVLINLWEVINTLEVYSGIKQPREELERTIFCYVFYHLKAIRDPKNRWYVSKADFPDDYMKNYCFAMITIIPRQLIGNMFRALKNATYSNFDDYFLTGELATKAGAKFKDFSSKALHHTIKKNRSGFLHRRIYFQETETIEQAEEMWNELKNGYYSRKEKYKEDKEWTGF